MQSQQRRSRSGSWDPRDVYGRTHDYDSGVITNALFAPRPHKQSAPEHNLENISKAKGRALEVGRFRKGEVIFRWKNC